MATDNVVNNLKAAADNLNGIDRVKILRPSLGDESLEYKLANEIDELGKTVEFLLEHAPNVHDSHVNAVKKIIDQITARIIQHADLGNPDYLSQRDSFLNDFFKLTNDLLQYKPFFTIAALETRGLLEDEGIKRQSEIAIEDMKNKSEEALKTIREESDRIIDETKKFAEEIEQKARRTAAHISVKDAQEQFKLAKKHHTIQVASWAVLSIVSIAFFIGFGFHLLNVELPKEWQWHTVYYTAIRIVILTAIGAVSTFCLKILRAHMHMYQHNLHRQRLTNSMAAFVESAITPEQRDLILGHLVDAVATFGSSGLLAKEDDTVYSPKMTIDTIARNLSVPIPK